MFQCLNCGSNEYKEEKVKKVFEIDNEIVVIENLPAKICKRCGEESFTRETLVHIQSIAYGTPKSYVKAKSYEYA